MPNFNSERRSGTNPYSRYATMSKRNTERFRHLGTYEVTAYTLQECGKAPDHPYYGVTASGMKATKYHTIAADLPFGTKLYIPYFKDWPNKGIFVVEDRGGAIKGKRLDVYFGENEVSQALEFGRRKLEVYEVVE